MARHTAEEWLRHYRETCAEARRVWLEAGNMDSPDDGSWNPRPVSLARGRLDDLNAAVFAKRIDRETMNRIIPNPFAEDA